MQKLSIAIVKNSENKVLVVRRIKPESGTEKAVLNWSFPSGKVESTEDNQAAAERETFDETGYKVQAVFLINEKDHPQFPVHVYYWSCELIDEHQYDISETEEIAEIAWIEPKQLTKLFTSQLDPKVAEFLMIK